MTASDRAAPRALLLTAGLGTRLQPLTYLRAKAAVPINGQALVVRVIRWLATKGVSDLVLNLHHHPASITGLVGDGRGLDVRVRYSWEQPVLGSAGGPRRALPLLTDGDAREEFLIVNGDTLTDMDVQALRARHQSSGALITMALIENPKPEVYGGVRLSADGFVTGFVPRGRGEGTYHFIGLQMAQASAFASLDDGVPYESVNSLYPKLIGENPRAIAGYVSAASFLDIGTPRDCLETSLLLAGSEGARLVGSRSNIDGSASIARCALWDDVTVGPDARLVDCIVGDGVTIPAGARFERCAIVPASGRPPATAERVDGDLLIRAF